MMAANASRAAFGEALIDLGARDGRFVSVDADLSKSTTTIAPAKADPSRAFNVDIAEHGLDTDGIARTVLELVSR